MNRFVVKNTKWGAETNTLEKRYGQRCSVMYPSIPPSSNCFNHCPVYIYTIRKNELGQQIFWFSGYSVCRNLYECLSNDPLCWFSFIKTVTTQIDFSDFFPSCSWFFPLPTPSSFWFFLTSSERGNYERYPQEFGEKRTETLKLMWQSQLIICLFTPWLLRATERDREKSGY